MKGNAAIMVAMIFRAVICVRGFIGELGTLCRGEGLNISKTWIQVIE